MTVDEAVKMFPETTAADWRELSCGAVAHKGATIGPSCEIRGPAVFRGGWFNGGVFYGTKGMLFVGKATGYRLYGERNKLIKEEKGGVESSRHQRNFLDAIKSGKPLSADIEVGHESAALVHLGNIVARTGRGVKFNAKTERIIGDGEADGLLKRSYRAGHWAVPKGV